jgi:hypothetical protein
MFRAILFFGLSVNLHAAAYLYQNSFITGTPAHCGGIKWCSTVAETAFRATRFVNKANQEGIERVWAVRDGTYIEVTCAIGQDSKMHANLRATSENLDSVNTWGAKVFKMMQGIRCM